MCAIFRPPGVSDVIVTGWQTDRLSVGAIDLRLEKEVGCETLGWIRIKTVQPVANNKRGHRRLAFLVAHSQLDGARGQCVEEHQDIVAKSDVLAALPYIEADLGRALPAIAARDLQDPVIERQPGKARAYRRLVIDGDLGPSAGCFLWGQRDLGPGIAGGFNIDVAAVGARDAEWRGDVGSVGP